MIRTRVKICGITNEADALAAVEAGADALGFNTWPGSKRHLDLETAAGWIARLPPFVMRVAVTVNEPIERLRMLAQHPAIDLLQLHGEESPAVCRQLSEQGISFIKAIGVQDGSSTRDAAALATPNLLLDAYAPGEFGGTGRRVDWALAAEFSRMHPHIRVILSGGLTPENVAEGVRIVRPFAVDVASGVEDAPGRKNVRRMREFIAAVRFAN